MIPTTRSGLRARRGTGALALLVLALAACNASHATDSTYTSTPSGGTSSSSAESSASSSSNASLASLTAPDSALAADMEAAAVDSAEGVTEVHAFHHGGVVEFVSVGLDTLGIPPDRRASVEAIQKDLDVATAPVRVAESALLVALASGVEAGKIDSRAEEAALARFSGAVAARVPVVDPLNKLHALLTPVERAALIDKILAHWELSTEANADEREGKGRLAMLTEAVALTPDQVTQIKTRLRAAQGLTTAESDATLTKAFDVRVRSFGAAFAGDPYDAKALSAGDLTDTHLETARATRMARFFEAATPVLTLAQRTDIAARLRASAADAAPPSSK